MCQITPETSKRICSHMNEDHGVSIYAMVLSALDQNDKKQNKAKEDNPMIKNMKISNCILKSVSLTQMKLSFVACDNENGICMSRDLMIDFDPPLKSSAEIRPRLIKLHQECLSPKFTWLFSDSVCRTIMSSVTVLGYFTIIGYDTFALDFQSNAPEFFKSIILFCFGSIESLFKGIVVSFYFAIIAHVLEATYVVYLCRDKLKLNHQVTFAWFMAVAMVGYPMTSKALDFVSIVDDLAKEKSKKHH